jgi:hypothetical protein
MFACEKSCLFKAQVNWSLGTTRGFFCALFLSGTMSTQAERQAWGEQLPAPQVELAGDRAYAWNRNEYSMAVRN